MSFSAIVNSNKTQANVSASGFFYKVTTPDQNIVWIPTNPDSLRKFQYSVHLENQLATSQEEVSKEGIKFNVFPNPNSGNFSIDYQLDNVPSRLQIDIFDVAGRLMFHKELPPMQATNLALDLPTLQKGTYIIQLSADKIQIHKKMVKI